MRRLTLPAPTLLLALVLGCSPGNVANPPGGGGDPAASACADLAFARCSRLQFCSATAVQLRYGDVPTCESLFKSVCLAALAAPSGQTPATEEACAQAIPSWNCADYIDNQNPPPSCAQKTGGSGSGMPCGLAAQCETGYCAIAVGQACGVCAAAPKSGDSCSQIITCGMSLVCAPATSTCAIFAQLGASCAPGQPCVAGLACVGANPKTGATGTCQPAVASQSDPCSFTGAGCDLFAGLACNAATSQCGIAQVVGEGSACGVVAGQNAYCASSGACVAGACVAGRPIGAPCDLVAGPPCLDLLHCVATVDGGTSGTCQAANAGCATGQPPVRQP
jgi:hypothetical protein